MLSLLMVLLIPLINTPAVSNAAESTPVSVSVVEQPGSDAGSGGFLVTVNHTDGVTTTNLVRVTLPDLLPSGARQYEVVSRNTNDTVNGNQGKFTPMPGETGVVMSAAAEEEMYSTELLHEVGYNPSTACSRNSSGACLTVALKDKPQTGTQVVQMPTTGAPEGLTGAGVSALAVGTAALLVAAVRRRV